MGVKSSESKVSCSLVMAKPRNLFIWKTKTEDGLKREVRAQLFGSKWSFKSQVKGDEEWTEHKPPMMEDLESLEFVLFNKYQRKHTSWEHVVSVRKLIAERGSEKS
ncbi:MAG: pterin-4a-carbinolamine dehydratase [Planctomycetota bacterium]|jgi:pterin-4a-carbinolamine dehydratase